MPGRRSNCSSSHHLTKLALSYAWYPITLVDKFTSRHDRRRKRQSSSKMLDHRGVCQTAPACALSHLQLVRARVLSGDAAAARTAYQDFFAIWKDADPAIPILKEAKAEYGKLQ